MAVTLPGGPRSALPLALWVRSVSKTFGTQEVLRRLDLDVTAGEVHAVVGHNGSGKSTFVKILAGYHRPDPGWVATVGGRELKLGSSRAAAAAGIRFVHQDLGLVVSLDAVDNIHLGGRFPTVAGRINWRAARRAATDVLGSLGYDLDVRRPVVELSAVERTVVALARALTGATVPTTLVVLDEPTAALSRADVAKLAVVLQRLRGLGVATIFISHHLDEVIDLSDTVTVLRDGAVAGCFSTAAVSKKSLVDVMVGHPVADRVRTPARATSAAPLLSVEDLRTSRLCGVSLHVDGGEIVGVAGLDGSGREQLAPAVFGAVSRTGEVTVGRDRLVPQRPDLAVLAGVACVPADRLNNALFVDMSALENVCIVGLPFGRGKVKVNSRHERDSLQATMADMAVRPLQPAMPIRTFSGGNQQKLVLARWLRTGPRVLILDEPTQGVDIATRDEIYQRIRRLAAAGTAVLVCSSDSEELEELADRVYVLSKGAITTELTGAEVSRHRIDSLALAAPRSSAGCGSTQPPAATDDHVPFEPTGDRNR